MPCGLWGFAFGDTDQGSCMNAVTIESMHIEDLGVFLYMIDNVEVSERETEVCKVCKLNN